MIKIAMLGIWNHYHADEFLDFFRGEESTVMWVWDTDRNRGRAWAEKKGIPYKDNLDEALRQGDIDGVVLNAEPWKQAEIIAVAMKNQVHILADKIVAMREEQITLLRECAQRYQGTFAVAYPLEGRAVFQTAAKFIESGKLGKLISIRLRQAHGGMLERWLPEHFYKNVEGGVFTEIGFPIFYLAPFLTGEELDEVTSMGSSLSGEMLEDNAAVLFKFQSGVLVIAEASYMSGISYFSLEVHGTKGSLIAGGPDKKIWLATEEKWQEITEENPSDSPENDWLQAIKENREPGARTGGRIAAIRMAYRFL